jgi:hypothetical protein
VDENQFCARSSNLFAAKFTFYIKLCIYAYYLLGLSLNSFQMSMITAATWVPRGFAAPFPAKYNFDEAEFERIAELAKLQLDDANEDLMEAQEDIAAEDSKSKNKSGKSEESSKTTVKPSTM